MDREEIKARIAELKKEEEAVKVKGEKKQSEQLILQQEIGFINNEYVKITGKIEAYSEMLQNE